MYEPTVTRIRALGRFRPDRFTLLLAALAVLGTGHILLREAAYGPWLHGDNVTYIQVARNLLAGEGFGYTRPPAAVFVSDREPYSSWPPLQPVLLAAASLFVFDPKDVVSPLNAVIFGLNVYVGGWWLRRRIESRPLVVFGCLALTFSIPLTKVASGGMSETPFILFIVLSLIQTEKYLDQGKRSDLIWAAAFTALACLTRYIGIAAIVAAVLLLVLQRGVVPWEKAKGVAVYASMSAAPIGLWMLRNLLLVGAPTGSREGFPSYSLPEILEGMSGMLRRWLFLDSPLIRIGFPDAESTGIALLALAAALSYVFVRSYLKPETSTAWRPFLVFGTFALTYMVLVVVAFAIGTSSGGIQTRYFSPAYIPLLLSGTFVLDRLLGHEREKKWLGIVGSLPIVGKVRGGYRLFYVILFMPLFLWVLYGAGEVVRHIVVINFDPNYDYCCPRYDFSRSKTLKQIQEAHLHGIILSNAVSVVYLHTDVPGRHVWLPSDLDGLKRFIANTTEEAYVVWLHGHRRWITTHYNALDLLMTPGLEPVATFTADGAIYKVNQDYTDIADPYRQIVSGEPVQRSVWNVYLYLDRRLGYVKSPCRPDDTEARFFLHVVPDDTDDLPAHRWLHSFDNLDFNFDRHGVRLNGKCLAIVELPEYGIATIATGQHTRDKGKVWGVEFGFDE